MNYLSAKAEVRRVEIYAMDLLWSIARRNYSSDIPLPSEVAANKRQDKRSAQQVIEDTISGIGGE